MSSVESYPEKRPLEGLPEMVQSQILSSFCDGKSISTYFHVLLTNHHLRPYAFDILRDALVDRYKNLASQCMGSNEEEVRDVVDIVREDIRKCNVRQTMEGRMVSSVCDGDGVGDGGHDHDHGEPKDIVTLVSGWCAIADLFEFKLRSTSTNDTGVEAETTAAAGSISREYVVWCGPLIKHGLTVKQAILTTPYWTITALDYFYSELELNNNAYLTHPATSEFLSSFSTNVPYGSLYVYLQEDADALHRIRYSLGTDPESPRCYLVPNHMEWEPIMGFSLNVSNAKSFTCHWDGEDGGDFDYSLSQFARNAIRIMRRIDGDDYDSTSDR